MCENGENSNNGLFRDRLAPNHLQISVSKSEKKLRLMSNPSNVTRSGELISFEQTKDSECEGFRVEQFLCSA